MITSKHDEIYQEFDSRRHSHQQLTHGLMEQKYHLTINFDDIQIIYLFKPTQYTTN